MQVQALATAPRGHNDEDLLALIRSRSKVAAAVAPRGAPAAAASGAGATPADTRQAVHRINEALRALATDLHFEVDAGSHEVVVRVIDRASGDVLRQIPSEATLRIARSLDRSTGHLINQRT